MDRDAIINRLVPPHRYQAQVAQMHPRPAGRFLFASTDTNAGYFLITDECGCLAELTTAVLGELVQEARLYGVKLKNMRIFGARSQIKRVPAGGRFYSLSKMEACA